VLRKNRNPFPKPRSEVILIDIEGTITDSLTHLPLPYANVYLNHTTFGTATDENGTFLLKNIPLGTYEFIFSYVGYKTMIYPLTLKPDRRLQFAVKLLPMAKELKSVIITTKRDKAWQ
jgi:outer membrane receptor for ferrienterochelin and colicins